MLHLGMEHIRKIMEIMDDDEMFPTRNEWAYVKISNELKKLHLKIKEPPLDTFVYEPIVGDVSKLAKHTVTPKETRYGIARMYGITVKQLEQINPQLGVGLPQGISINVPLNAITETAVPETGYLFYAVQPKEGFFRLKVKTNLTKEKIIALNPYACLLYTYDAAD